MRVASYLFVAVAVVSAVLGVQQVRQYVHHVSDKADRLDAHCALMKTFLSGIEQDVDHGGVSATTAVSVFHTLEFNDFRMVRLCTTEQPFELCPHELDAACIHRTISTIRQAWAW